MVENATEIPRATCRLFGAIKAASTLRNSVILVHGPKGCVYHINYILGMRGDRVSPVFSTCLDENDVVFGAERKLKDAIEELDARRSPEILVVLSCCASSIIGEDVQGAIASASTRAVVIGIDAGGFAGDYTEGYADTLLRIVEVCSGAGSGPNPRKVNLLGVLRAGPDVRELRRLLSLIGVEVIAVLPAGASVDDLSHLGEASLNIVLCETSGLSAARYLGEKYGTPFLVAEFPVGLKSSRDFLLQVSESLGFTGDLPIPDLPEPLPLKGKLPRIAIVSGPTRAVSLTRFLSSHGIAPRLIVLDFDSGSREKVAAAAGPGCVVLVSPEWDEIRKRLEEEQIEVLIGGMMERPLASELGIRLLDIMHGSQKTAGPGGGENLLRLILQGNGQKE
ncbi:MAG: nitrogenase component 1 [Methanolinea sp.]|nr:nitrogenase component 1 [Methanolinea sp.]